MLVIQSALHGHVAPGGQRLYDGVLFILRKAVGDQFLFRFIIGHDKARKFPLVPQYAGQQSAVAGRWHPANVVER